ncbi:hypothetical protein [Bacteroides sp.]|uniref:hypothetical protein n=1 Tax=Bacteroides sp. TaxID=29523 RepID=UPI0035292B8D
MSYLDFVYNGKSTAFFPYSQQIGGYNDGVIRQGESPFLIWKFEMKSSKVLCNLPFNLLLVQIRQMDLHTLAAKLKPKVRKGFGESFAGPLVKRAFLYEILYLSW